VIAALVLINDGINDGIVFCPMVSKRGVWV